MKKVAILIAVAVLVLLIAPVMSYEIGNDVIYNVSTNKAQGEVIINMTIQAFSYDIDDTGHLIGSLHYIDNPTPSDIVISRDFNVVIVPSENCTIDNIYHTITTVSEPSYSYTESISVNPGTYLIVICNPGKNWREEGCVYEGMGGIGVNEFWNILQNAIINKTQSEILEMITEVTVGAYGSDDLIYVFDPLVEIKQPVPTSTPTIEPTPSSTSVPTSSPTPSPTPTVATTPTPTPTVTPTPQPIQTPKQPGFEAIVVIVSLLVTCLCLRRRN